ncbi:MAG: hypothetical protein ACI4TU_06330 [Candidatus Cryptobacteroides sp.]
MGGRRRAIANDLQLFNFRWQSLFKFGWQWTIDPFTPVVETPVDLKYFFVNTATGEKSGEMMQAVRQG